MGIKGYVMQVQPFSVNDGDGIRTTIFLAGCPLRCRWCSNPEGFRREPLIGWHMRKCIACGECVKVCPAGIGIDLNQEREQCIACGRCTEVCPRGARIWMVRQAEADDILQDIQKHRLFYRYSGGGITFSGGECTAQPDFLNYLTSHIYDMGYSMAIETCGYFDFDRVRESLERMDLIFMDLKEMDEEKHRAATGVSNAPILANIRRLNQVSARAVIRIPVIGGFNDDEENIRRSAAYVHDALPKAKMELLPCHKLGMVKYQAIGLPFDSEQFTCPSKEKMEQLRNVVRSQGVETIEFR